MSGEPDGHGSHSDGLGSPGDGFGGPGIPPSPMDARSPLPTIEEVRENLSRRMSERPSMDTLVQQNILKDFGTAPGLHAQQAAFARARVEDSLQRKLPLRPPPQFLQQTGILKSAVEQ